MEKEEKKLTPEQAEKEKAKAEKRAQRKNKRKGLWKEFKAFITRGNVVDMAVGVVIGGAFSAIVTSVVNILLSICTWGVPGGLSGLFTVLPALNATQAGLVGIGQSFSSSDLQDLAEKMSLTRYGETEGADPLIIETVKNEILSKYTLHGGTYVYNTAALIDWGAVINAIISFLIIAFTLFVIVKVYNYLSKKRKEMEEALREEYYKKHPEKRPAPVEVGAPKPTELDVLLQIKEELKLLNGASEEKK